MKNWIARFSEDLRLRVFVASIRARLVLDAYTNLQYLHVTGKPFRRINSLLDDLHDVQGLLRSTYYSSQHPPMPMEGEGLRVVFREGRACGWSRTPGARRTCGGQ